MPRDIKIAISQKSKRFKKKQEDKKVKKAPIKDAVVHRELRSRRSVRSIIREAAINLMLVEILYKKTTTNETKKYLIAPYELSFKRLKVGRRKVLWGYDVNSKHIKTYALRNIKTVKRTDKGFNPEWPVKIK